MPLVVNENTISLFAEKKSVAKNSTEYEKKISCP